MDKRFEMSGTAEMQMLLLGMSPLAGMRAGPTC
jgi:hypothetical protein